ncbi:MAG: glycosyltransferase family 2 protein [Halorhabdus sp.]
MTDRIEKPIVSPDPNVSVVIPTIPENDHEQVVSNLRDQTHDNYEVIVVNDPYLDICEARNRGIEVAIAPIVALTDDDTRPFSGWIEAVSEGFSGGVGIVEGPVSGGMKNNKRGMYVGCNVAFRREKAEDLGGFDPQFAGWRDDTEFGWRMEKAHDGKWVEKMKIKHPDTPNSTIDETKESLLKERHPDLYQERVVPDSFVGKVNHRLWRIGFWDAVDKVRS